MSHVGSQSECSGTLKMMLRSRQSNNCYLIPSLDTAERLTSASRTVVETPTIRSFSSLQWSASVELWQYIKTQ